MGSHFVQRLFRGRFFRSAGQSSTSQKKTAIPTAVCSTLGATHLRTRLEAFGNYEKATRYAGVAKKKRLTSHFRCSGVAPP